MSEVQYRYWEHLISCRGCRVAPNTLHKGWCYYEQCPLCGGRMATCPCLSELAGLSAMEYERYYSGGPTVALAVAYDKAIKDSGGRMIWEGVMAGTLDAIRNGWWCRVQDECDRAVRSEASDPGARPDLNRCNALCAVWNKALRRWEPA